MKRAEIEELLDGTTPEPWWADVSEPTDVVVWAGNEQFIVNIGQRVQPVSVAFDCDEANARLIATAPTLARQLLAVMEENERLREEIMLMHQDAAGESL
jgi:hypothetical protein